jgi:predicted DNA-binding transcriptional regulator YafY
MLYQRSLDIEQRLRLVLELIGTGEYSTPGLAERAGVSIPTISRDVQALRERGHEIRSEKRSDGWRYVLAATSLEKRKRMSTERPTHPR